MSEIANPTSETWPQTIAIAGAWGYIGRRFLDAAWQLGMTPAVFDPGPQPTDVPTDRIQRFNVEDTFYRHSAELFHLALPPQARARALATLLARSRHEPIAILNEKPMAAPEHAEQCRQLIEDVDASGALMLFDFLELFSPLTQSIVDYLSRFRRVEIQTIEMQRTKDREDPDNLRNRKIITPVQYQESVHCLAWVLFLLGRLRESLSNACAGGLRISAEAQPYVPPNPADYPYVVDGRCQWQIDWGETKIMGLTDFKRHAPWSKRRVLRGQADGRPLVIEAEYLEGNKQLVINGVQQPIDAKANSYVQVIDTYSRWRRDADRAELLGGIYPNPRFALATYQLSSALWRSAYDHRVVTFNSYDDLLGFEARFAAAVPQFERYR